MIEVYQNLRGNKQITTAKQLHSTRFYITEHKVSLRITCEITKGRETDN